MVSVNPMYILSFCLDLCTMDGPIDGLSTKLWSVNRESFVHKKQ